MAPARLEQGIAEEQLERLRLLQELTAALSAAVTPEEVARVVLTEGLTAAGAQGGELFWEEEGQLELIRSQGWSPSVEAGEGSGPGQAEQPAAEAYRTGAPVWLTTPAALLAAFPALAAPIREQGDQAWVGMPLVVERPRGAIGLRYGVARAFSREERAHLAAVARLLAQALDRASLFARQQTLAARLGALQETTAHLAAALTPRQVAEAIFRGLERLRATRAALWQLAEDGDRLELVHATGTGTGIGELARDRTSALQAATPAAEAARTGRPIFLDAPQAIAAAYPELEPERAQRREGVWAAVPLVVEQRTIGVLAFALAERHRLPQDERLLSVALAQIGGQALERARLFEGMERVSRRMASVHGAAAALSGAVTPAEMAEAVARAVELLGASVVELFVLQGAERVRRVAAVGRACGEEVAEQPVAMDAPHPVADVARTGRALWLEDDQAFLARWPHLADARLRTGIQACALLPLLAGGRTMGVLLVGFTAARELPAEDRSFLRLVAVPCAAALDRAVWRHPTPGPMAAITVEPAQPPGPPPARS